MVRRLWSCAFVTPSRPSSRLLSKFPPPKVSTFPRECVTRCFCNARGKKKGSVVMKREAGRRMEDRETGNLNYGKIEKEVYRRRA